MVQRDNLYLLLKNNFFLVFQDFLYSRKIQFCKICRFAFLNNVQTFKLSLVKSKTHKSVYVDQNNCSMPFQLPYTSNVFIKLTLERLRCDKKWNNFRCEQEKSWPQIRIRPSESKCEPHFQYVKRNIFLTSPNLNAESVNITHVSLARVT